MYLPKHQYQFIKPDDLPNLEDLVDKAGNVINANREIVLTSSGELFDKVGIDFDKGDFSKAKKLFIKYFDEDVDPGFTSEGTQEDKLSDNQRAVSFKPAPTEAQLKKGVMIRAFYKNTSTGKLKEITHNTAKKIAKINKPYEKVYVTEWLVKGPAKDQIINGYFFEGIETKNQRIIDIIKVVLPGAENLISGPDEYVVDTLPLSRNNVQPQKTSFSIPAPSKGINVSKDINSTEKNQISSDKVKENLYARPGEFLIEGTNKEYSGFYHIHPTKGPMVGAKHVSTPHSRLVPRDKSKRRYGLNIVQSDTTTTPQTRTTPAPARQSGQTYTSSPSPSTSTSTPSTSGGSSSGGSSSSGGGYSGY